MHYNSYYTNGLLQHLAQNNTAPIPNPIYASVSNKNPCVTNTVSWLSSAVSDPDPSYVFLILLLQPATVTHVSRAAAVSVCENRTHTCTSLERLLPSTVYQDSCILCKPIDWEQGQAPLTRLKKKYDREGAGLIYASGLESAHIFMLPTMLWITSHQEGHTQQGETFWKKCTDII